MAELALRYSIPHYRTIAAWPPRKRLGLLALFALLLLLIGAIDRLTGPLLSTSVFYLVPIALATWYLSRRLGIVLALTGAGLWLLNDVTSGSVTSHPLIPFWNAGVRLLFFLIVVLALSRLRVALQKQEALIEFVVHDLRSPLGNILMSLDLLESSVQTLPRSQAANEAGKLLEISSASGERMLTLINSLLDLARLENGQMPINLREADLNDLFSAAQNQVRSTAGRKQVALTSTIEPDLPAVLVDPELTVRVLVNLLGNAVRFSPSESEVRLRAARAPSGQVVVEVSDQGPGIPDRWRQRIFSRFGQVDAREAGVSAGSGLGLAFCQLAVDAQQGRIWVKPETTIGATICFTCPLSRRMHAQGRGLG